MPWHATKTKPILYAVHADFLLFIFILILKNKEKWNKTSIIYKNCIAIKAKSLFLNLKESNFSYMISNLLPRFQ